MKFNQDSLYLINDVEKVLKLELNNSFSNILSKLFNMTIKELKYEIKILKLIPDVPNGTYSESVYMWLE